MKKSISAFTAVTICAAISLTAFAIPVIIRASAQKEYEEPIILETNPEYLNDFSTEAGTQQLDWNKYLAILPSEQIEVMKAETLKRLKNEFNTAIPDNFSFEFNSLNKEHSDGSKMVETKLIWSDGTYGTELFSASTQFIIATFESSKEPNILPELTSLNLKNILHEEYFSPLADTGLNFLADTLMADKDTEALILTSQVILNQQKSEKNLAVYLDWIHKESNETHYHVSFENVNFFENTGIITGAENNAAIMKQKDTELNSTLEAELLETAKEFLNENNIEFGNLLIRPNGNPSTYRINETLYFTFEKKTDSNNSSRDFVSVYIDKDKNILGFYY